MDTKENKWVGF